MRKDLRRHQRYLVDSSVLQVAWLDATGELKMTRTRALNISQQGIAIELPEAAIPLSMVRFQSDRFKTRGQGMVRHCRRVGNRFILGLEFTEDLHWRPPEGEVREPISICGSDSDC